MNATEYLNALSEAVTDHLTEDEEERNLHGILDHVFGYKKIKDYTLVE